MLLVVISCSLHSARQSQLGNGAVSLGLRPAHRGVSIMIDRQLARSRSRIAGVAFSSRCCTNASSGAVLSRAGTLEREPQYASAIPSCIEPRELSTALEWARTIAP